MKKNPINQFVGNVRFFLDIIIGCLDSGDYKQALEYCEQARKEVVKAHIDSKAYFQLDAHLLYYNVQALLLKQASSQTEEEMEEMHEEVETALFAFVESVRWAGKAFHRKMQPLIRTLLADCRYLDYLEEEDYDADDWLQDYLEIAVALKKKRGAKNRIFYAETIYRMVTGYLQKQGGYGSADREKLHNYLTEALEIYEKEDPNNPRIFRIKSLLAPSWKSSDVDLDIDWWLDLMKGYSQHSQEDFVAPSEDNLADQADTERNLCLLNFAMAWHYFAANDIEHAGHYSDLSINHCILCLDKLHKLHGAGIESSQLLQQATIVYVILFYCKGDKKYILSLLELWKKEVSEFRRQNLENRTGNETGSRKEYLSTLTSIFNYNDRDSICVLSAQLHMALCYILLDDIQQAMNCKKEMEGIFFLDEDFFDEKTVAIWHYPLYAFLYVYYHNQQQIEEAEKCRQTYLSARDLLSNSEYGEQMLMYDSLLEVLLKSTW